MAAEDWELDEKRAGMGVTRQELWNILWQQAQFNIAVVDVLLALAKGNEIPMRRVEDAVQANAQFIHLRNQLVFKRMPE